MNQLAKLLYVIGWAAPFCIAFVASVLWQGAVVGWKAAIDCLDSID